MYNSIFFRLKWIRCAQSIHAYPVNTGSSYPAKFLVSLRLHLGGNFQHTIKSHHWPEAPVKFETPTNIINKPLNLEKAVEVANLARKHRLTTVGYFIIGFPGETMEQIKRTIRFAHSLRLDYFRAFIYNPLPGSPLWSVCKEKGYIPEDYHYEAANNYFQSDLNTVNFGSEELAQIQAQLRHLSVYKSCLSETDEKKG